MLEMIVTVAMVSIFFTVMAMTVPTIMNNYVEMKRMNKALEMATIIENGLSAEFAKSWNHQFSDDVNDRRLKYNSGEYMRTFPVELDTELTYKSMSIPEATQYLSVKGQPLIYDTVLDKGFYDGFSAQITIYKDNQGAFFANVQIFDENDVRVTVSEKPLTIYMQ
ncbi:MAG: hypothetical protein MJ105_01930 [Lachnospiraceae bacterium]|nr:hypothetical protein [Lachnospiraceae bacterium]